MRRRPRLHPATLLALGLGGVLVGHSIVYRLLIPDAHTRAAELAATGHGYLSGADAIATVAIVAALAYAFLGGVLRAPAPSGALLVGRIAAFQVAAFVAMEGIERLASGTVGHALPAVLLVGLPVQLVVALAIAAVAAWLARAGRAVTGSPREVVGARPAVLARNIAPPSLLRAGARWAPRGRSPPSLLPV
jgi:hypothetical protein